MYLLVFEREWNSLLWGINGMNRLLSLHEKKRSIVAIHTFIWLKPAYGVCVGLTSSQSWFLLARLHPKYSKNRNIVKYSLLRWPNWIFGRVREVWSKFVCSLIGCVRKNIAVSLSSCCYSWYLRSCRIYLLDTFCKHTHYLMNLSTAGKCFKVFNKAPWAV